MQIQVRHKSSHKIISLDTNQLTKMPQVGWMLSIDDNGYELTGVIESIELQIDKDQASITEQLIFTLR